MSPIQDPKPDTLTSKNVAPLTVGSTAWPNRWPYQPQYPTPIINQWVTNAPTHDYANELEVEEHEHDAILRFYRTRDKSKTLVKEITIPLGLLEWLRSKGDETN